MKNKIILGFVFLLMVLPFCMSVDVEMKNDLKIGENFVAKVSGNFLDKIEFENIEFYRRHMPTVIKDVGVLEIEGDYYIYGQIQESKEADNYSLQINDVRYMNGSKISEETIIKNFTIIGETVEFSASPLVLFLNNTGFMEIQNLKSTKLIISVEKISEMPTENLFFGNTETDVSEEDSPSFLESLFGSRSFDETNITNETANTTTEVPKTTYIAGTNSIELKSGEIKTIEIPFKNNSGLELFRLFSENQQYYLYVFFGINNTFIGEIINESNATIVSEDNETETDVEIIIEEDNKSEMDKDTIRKSELTCAQLNGSVCIANETCSEELIQALDSDCCVGECKIKNSSNTGKTVGWILIILIVIFLTWFFKKKFKK